MKKYNFFLQLFNVFLSLLVLYIANLIVIRDFDDNESYNLAFQSIGDLEIKEAYFVFSKIIGGGVEPVYFLLNYIFNNYLNFNILIMLINIIFLYFIHRALRTFYPKNYLVIYTALEGHPSMKQVIVVDQDIDTSDPVRVEWALMTRWQPDKDTIILSNQKGSSLDPSRSEDGLTSKIGMDASLPPEIDKTPYESVL